MRIGCLQFAPQVGDVSNNLTRADAVLAKADPMEVENLDLLVLPEMAFSGYNFKSLEEIQPYLEPSGSGISSLWARTTALKYDCTVAVGYPEKVESSRRRPSSPEYYNSLILVNGDGETIANYRKSFLYYTDETWALEGGGFFGGEVEDFGKVAMGICMDINPYKFEAPWHAFEFGFHILEVRANLVIISMAWLTREDQSTFTPFPREPDLSTVTYWLQRLEPVIRAESDEEIIVVFCNRCGIEDDVVYAGTSTVVGIKNGEVSVYGLLGRGVKELLVVNTDLPPFAKLVNRPESMAAAQPEAGEPVPEQASKEQHTNTSSRPVPGPAHASTGAPASPAGQYHANSAVSTRNPQPWSDPSVQTTASDTNLEGQEMRLNNRRYEPQARATESSLPVYSEEPASFEDQDDCSDCSDSSESGSYHGCAGDCDGCEEHSWVQRVGELQTPTYPDPTPVSMRPKLAVSTGREELPPATRRKPPPGMQPGNYFTSRDLCTPPVTPYEEPHKSAHPIYRNPRSPYPASASIPTPREPVWPSNDVSNNDDFERIPSRGPSRPPSRGAKARHVEANPVDDRDARESRRHGSKSRNVSRSRETDAILSPTISHRSFRSDPGRALKQQQQPRRMGEHHYSSSDRARPKTSRAAAMIQEAMIPIAASPSVFKTSFTQEETTAPSREANGPLTAPLVHRPASRSGHKPKSKSAVGSVNGDGYDTIPMFQYQPPPIPQSKTSVRTTTFPPTSPARRTAASEGAPTPRSRSRARGVPQHNQIPPVPPPPPPPPPAPGYAYQNNTTAYAADGHSFQTAANTAATHPDIQALVISEEEAFYRGIQSPVADRGESQRSPIEVLSPRGYGLRSPLTI